MALLLMAGLALVPEDLQKAAKVDGATAWQRFRRVTLPLMKPAILVALLFRTLDAFRIFDNIFILTGGGHDTGSVSILGYDNLFTALNLGIGSAISVLIFICVAIIAFLFIKGFGAAAPGTAVKTLMATTAKPEGRLGSANTSRSLLALIPVLWIVSLSFKDPATITDASFWPKKWTWDNYRGIFKTSEFTRALVNSIGIALISTFIAVVLASMAAYAVARLDFPGKSVLIGMSLLIAMFPAISLVTPLFNIERALGTVRHVAGPDHPVHHLRPAARHLHAVGVLPRDPVGAGEGGEDGRRHAVPGVHQGHRAARRAGHVHHRDPRVHLLLERLPLRDLADVDDPGPDGAGRDRVLHREFAVHGADRLDRGGRRHHHHPDHLVRAVLPATHRRRADVRRGQGLGADSG